MPGRVDTPAGKMDGQRIYTYLSLVRPRHWVKNILIFAAPFFGGTMLERSSLLMVLPVFLAFSLSASSVYIFNDIADLERDRLHPRKRERPIASGRISSNSAAVFAILLVVSSLILSYEIDPAFFHFILAYLLIQLCYSIYLKDIALVDIFCIASGFIIRVLAGGAAFNVEVSNWLLITMFMISLVLAAGKRLGEFNLLNEKADEHRTSLKFYSTPLLNEILIISSSSALIAYALYTVEQFKSLVYTIPIVTFGLFRYIMLSKEGLGDPTEAISGDSVLALTIIIWILVVGMIRYT